MKGDVIKVTARTADTLDVDVGTDYPIYVHCTIAYQGNGVVIITWRPETGQTASGYLVCKDEGNTLTVSQERFRQGYDAEEFRRYGQSLWFVLWEFQEFIDTTTPAWVREMVEYALGRGIDPCPALEQLLIKDWWPPTCGELWVPGQATAPTVADDDIIVSVKKG
jgi:hypothetical protein